MPDFGGLIDAFTGNRRKSFEAARHALALLEQGRAKEALPIAEEATRLDPNQGMAWHALGWALIATGQPKRAIEPAARAAQSNGAPPILWVLLGDALLVTGDHHEALKAYANALQEPRAVRGAIQAAAEAGFAQTVADLSERFLQQHPPDPGVLFTRARALFKLGRLQEALEAADRFLALAKTPDHPRMLETKALVLGGLKRHAEAVPVWLEALRALPQDESSTARTGLQMSCSIAANQLAMEGKHDEASRLFESVVAADPASDWAWEQLVRALLRAGKPDVALQRVTQALAKDNQRAGLHAAKAVALLHFGREAEALAAADTALAKDPKEPAALAARAFALALARRPEASAALAAAEAVAKGDPVLTGARGVLRQRDRRLTEARADFEAALASDPSLGPALLHHGSLLADGAEYGRAIESLDAAMKLMGPRVDALLLRAYCLELGGRSQEVAETLDKAAAVAPRDPRPWVMMANQRFLEDDHENAEEAVDQACARDPRSPAALATRAAYLLAIGAADLAVTACEQASAADPTFRPAWDLKGIALRRMGKFEDAVAAFDKALQLGIYGWDGSDPATFLTLHVLKTSFDSKRGRYLSNSGTNPATWAQKSLALTQLGPAEEALKLALQAVGAESLFPPAWVARGQAHLALQQPTEAVRAFDVALKLEPSNREAALGKAEGEKQGGKSLGT